MSISARASFEIGGCYHNLDDHEKKSFFHMPRSDSRGVPGHPANIYPQ